MIQRERRNVQRRVMRVLGGLACAAALTVMATPAGATPIHVTGSTLGCFSTACVPATDDDYAPFGLTFSGIDDFDLWTDTSGTASGILLGTLRRGNVNVPNALGSLPFSLQVVFDLDGAGSKTIIATILPTTPGGGGPLTVDFDNSWYQVDYGDAYGTGSFEFALTGDLSLAKNGDPTPIYGAIRGGTYTETFDDLPAGAVPEPASILLFGAGILLVARRLRRRPAPSA